MKTLCNAYGQFETDDMEKFEKLCPNLNCFPDFSFVYDPEDQYSWTEKLEEELEGVWELNELPKDFNDYDYDGYSVCIFVTDEDTGETFEATIYTFEDEKYYEEDEEDEEDEEYEEDEEDEDEDEEEDEDNTDW